MIRDREDQAMDFKTELLRITEAYCLHANIPIRRRFTDAELEESLGRVRDAIERQQPIEIDDDPDNFDYDPDYARQDAEARGEWTNYPRRSGQG